MKAKILSLVAGMALVANMGFVQAAELDKTASVPDILNGVVAHGATMMTPTEMETVRGQRLLYKRTSSSGAWWKITVRQRGRKGRVRIRTVGPVPQSVRDIANTYL